VVWVLSFLGVGAFAVAWVLSRGRPYPYQSIPEALTKESGEEGKEKEKEMSSSAVQEGDHEDVNRSILLMTTPN
jgi:hypothetical protein